MKRSVRAAAVVLAALTAVLVTTAVPADASRVLRHPGDRSQGCTILNTERLAELQHLGAQQVLVALHVCYMPAGLLIYGTDHRGFVRCRAYRRWDGPPASVCGLLF